MVNTTTPPAVGDSGSNNYAQKLLDPRWQRKRLQIFERDNWACCKCFNDKETLHVHHCFYIKYREPWEYKDSNLVTLCATCHNEESASGFNGRNAFSRALSAMGLIDSQFAAAAVLIERANLGPTPWNVLDLFAGALSEPGIYDRLKDLYLSYLTNGESDQ